MRFSAFIMEHWLRTGTMVVFPVSDEPVYILNLRFLTGSWTFHLFSGENQFCFIFRKIRKEKRCIQPHKELICNI